MKKIMNASLSKRVFACFIDFLIPAFLAQLIYRVSISNLEEKNLIELLFEISNILFYLFYYPITTYYYGQTLGKRILKIKIVSDDLTQITLKQSFFRDIFWFPHRFMVIFHGIFDSYTLLGSKIQNSNKTPHEFLLEVIPLWEDISKTLLIFTFLYSLFSLIYLAKIKNGKVFHDLLANTKVINIQK